tara:strand:- start:786 stop:956 length:171 start_codon:yes stop_codon:yes gene_type:complete
LHFVSSFLVLHQGMAKGWPAFWQGSRPIYHKAAIVIPIADKRRLMLCIIFFPAANQ